MEALQHKLCKLVVKEKKPMMRQMRQENYTQPWFCIHVKIKQTMWQKYRWQIGIPIYMRSTWITLHNTPSCASSCSSAVTSIFSFTQTSYHLRPAPFPLPHFDLLGHFSHVIPANMLFLSQPKFSELACKVPTFILLLITSLLILSIPIICLFES